MYYFAIFEKDEEGYQIYVPDVAGATAMSETDDIDNAVHVMEGILKICLEDFDFKNWPKASSLEGIRKQESEFLNENTFIMPIRAIGTKGKNEKVTISMPDYVLSLIDDEAKKAGVSRSAYIANSVLGR